MVVVVVLEVHHVAGLVVVHVMEPTCWSIHWPHRALMYLKNSAMC